MFRPQSFLRDRSRSGSSSSAPEQRKKTGTAQREMVPQKIAESQDREPKPS